MRLRLLSLLAAAALALPACASFEPAAAVVGSNRIENEDFVRLVDFVLADPRFAEETPMADPDVQRQTLIRQVLTFLIQQEVIDEKAADEGIEVEREEVDAILEQQVEQIGGQEALDEQLAESGATIEDVRGLIRAQAVRAQVAQAVVEEEVPEDQLRATYEERAREFTEVHASHILVGSAGEADRIAEQATPRNFAQLARSSSEDQGSAQNGGDLGARPVSEYVDAFANAALEIPQGEIGGPVQSEFGFHIILIHSRETISFEEARDRLLEELAPEAFRGWMLERLRSLTVRVNPRYGTFDQETGEVVARNATTPLPGPQVTP
ncbi:MAG TPA: peptidylprolyl isomerase [Actinomycetota bacterium]|nr:peptidylprolyl isomerase [Actinomycetota bacterium]